MAVTGAIFNSLTFGDVNSADYGIYITGEAVYNAPARMIEMISVPGRNGDLILDSGAFENIEVTYPAGTFGRDQENFSEIISDFRNALKSKKGYQRITDTYNRNEFRLGAFVDAVEVEPVNSGESGKFNLVFNCKPQRFLTSGETAVAVTDGDTIANPTLFDADPLLLIEGYGRFSVNGYPIQIENDPIGKMLAVDAYMGDIGRGEYVADFSTVYLMADDPIMVSNALETERTITYSMLFRPQYGMTIASATIEGGSDTLPDPPYGNISITGVTKTATLQDDGDVLVEIAVPNQTFAYGTARGKTRGGYLNLKIGYYRPDESIAYNTGTVSYRLIYDGAKKISFYVTTNYSFWEVAGIYPMDAIVSVPGILVESTAPKFGHPTYIDCDIGEAYGINDGVISSLNRYIALGSNLPTLNPGENEITADETITGLSIIPRWWII